MISFHRYVWMSIVGILLLLTIKSASASRPMIPTVTETLAADKKYGGIVLPRGTVVDRHPNGSSIYHATLRKSLTYCRIKLPSGTSLSFIESPPWLSGVQLFKLHRVRDINLPKGTQILFDRNCNIDSFITHDSDIDFGYAKLNGSIYLYPNGRVKQSHTQSIINIRGISAIGQLEFWPNGQLQEFYSGKSQVIKGIPIQSNACVQIDSQGNPVNFVLAQPHKFTNGEFQFNDRVRIDADGKASLIDRGGNNRRPMTNC